jgi:hypothetical protein
MLDEDYPDHCQSWCEMQSKPQAGPSRANLPGYAGQPESNEPEVAEK